MTAPSVGARLVVAAVLVATVAACGVDVASPPPTRAELQRALLTLEDVGERYADVTGEEEEEEEVKSLDEAFDYPEGCRQVAERFEDGGDESLAKVTFDDDDDESSIENSYDLRSEVEIGVDTFLDVVEACPVLPYDSNELTGELRLSGKRIDGLGDKAIEVRFESEFTSPIEVTVVGVGYYWERGEVVAGVSGVGGIDQQTLEAAPFDEGRVRELAGIADRRLAEVIDA